MNAAIYCRVSSAKQVEGLSLSEQEKRCRAYIEARGWQLADEHVYVERGVSGAKSSRPALDRLVIAAEAGEFGALVAPAVDRLGRSGVHTAVLFDRLDRADVRLYSDTGQDYSGDTKEGRLTRNVLAAAAEFERDSISERVRAITPAKRERGSYNGGPRPYGYDFADDGLVIREDEAEVVRRIFRQFNSGTPLRAIARGLNEDGIRGPLGGTWSQGRVAEKLDQALYAGKVGGGAQGRHEPLISEADWQRTRELREAQHEANPRGGRHANAHLLGHGLLQCKCGASMYPRKDSRSGRDTYRCRGRDDRTTACTMPPLPRDGVDRAVRAYLARDILSPALVRGDLEAEMKRAVQEAKRAGSAAEREASKAEARIEKLRLAWLDEELTRAEFEETREQLERDLTAAKARAAEARRVAEALRRPTADLLEAVESIRKAAASAHESAEGLAAQRTALARIFERFELFANPIEEPPAVSPEEVAAQEAAAAGLPAERIPELAEAISAQEARDAQDFPGPGVFIVRPRGGPALSCILHPIPRAEVAARYGLDPGDSLRELHPFGEDQNDRDGLPMR